MLQSHAFPAYIIAVNNFQMDFPGKYLKFIAREPRIRNPRICTRSAGCGIKFISALISFSRTLSSVKLTPPPLPLPLTNAILTLKCLDDTHLTSPFVPLTPCQNSLLSASKHDTRPARKKDNQHLKLLRDNSQISTSAIRNIKTLN